MLKFFWNGIKDNGGKLQTCHYSLGNVTKMPCETLTIYKREYNHFSAGIHEAFKVENDSEIISDYIVQDLTRVLPDHPLYSQVLKAYHAQQEHRAIAARKRAAKCLESRAY